MIAYFIDGPLDLTKFTIKVDSSVIFAQVFDHGNFISNVEDAAIAREQIIHRKLVRYRHIGRVGLKNQGGEPITIYIFDGYDEA